MREFIYKRINVIVTVVFILLVTSFLAVQSGRFNEDPVVERFPDNCYENTLVVVTDKDYRPYSFLDSKGNFSGHDVELINMIANELKMNLVLKFMSWDEGIKEVTEGFGDVLMTCDYSNSFFGVEKLLKSEPVSSDAFIVYSKRKINSSDELYGKRIGVMKNGNVMIEINKMNLKNYCVEYDDNRKAMQALIAGEIDYAVMRQTVGTVLLSELDASGIKGYTSIGDSYMCFGINKEKKELVGKINAALEKFKVDGSFERLRNKWLTTFVKPYTILEIFKQNNWMFIVFAVFIFGIVSAFVMTNTQKRKAEEKWFRSSQIVEWLTQDFECLNYIKITERSVNDPVINIRVSEKLKELIPGWENETFYSHKLDLLRDTLVYEPDRKQFDEDIRRKKVLSCLNEYGVYYVNMRFFFEGEIHYYQMKFSPVYEGTDFRAIVAGLHSVDTQTKKVLVLQEQLKDALSRAEVASKAKTEFLFNMSHDIRTPLNAITGFTNMAIKHIDDKERVLDCLNKTQQSGNLLLLLINSVLDVSRIESGKATLEEQNVDVYYSFINIDSTMHEMAAAKNIKLTFEVDDVADRYVYCDFNRCNRIFVNIISNAIKYTNEGGWVKVKCSQIGSAENGYGKYMYTFEDNGIGMSEEFQKHVFEKFSREKNVTLSGIQGTGLGMAVCKSFVELMNGTIECKSKIGEGTTFTVILPFRIQKDEMITDTVTGEVFTVGEAFIQKKKDFKGKKVLLAEDNELNLEIAVDILEEAGMVCDTVGDGTEAVERLKETGPDFYNFILMDIFMPVMSGYEATTEIRKLYPDVHIPIIALSANAFAEDKTASKNAGMDGHVAKPIDIEELFKALSRFV